MVSMKYTVYKTDDSQHQFDAEKLDLQTMQKVVGGLIEIINLQNGYIMIVNEEGKLNNLPINIQASIIFQHALNVTDDFIVGDVIVAPENMVD